eukprot:31384-Pelagococcus_subviridis.AAC.20
MCSDSARRDTTIERQKVATCSPSKSHEQQKRKRPQRWGKKKSLGKGSYVKANAITTRRSPRLDLVPFLERACPRSRATHFTSVAL